MSPPAGEDAWLAEALAAFRAAGPQADVTVGIGDDAAAVRVLGGEVVVATDVIVDGVHFELARCGAAAAARKAVAVNLSDLAACGAAPLAFVVGGVMPRPPDRALFDALMAGFAGAADAFGCPCVGGDTNSADGPLVLAVTVLGRPGPMGVLRRAGARVGDVLSVTGPLGGALAGRHLAFRPRIAEAHALCAAGVPHAMMDLSDGLGRDLPRLCRASGVGARVERAAIPVHRDVVGAFDPVARAVGDGEDFELLVAHAPLAEATDAALRADGVTLHPVGRVVEAARGLAFVGPEGETPFTETGFDHLGA